MTRLWSDLVLVPERACGDCWLVGCARLCQDDANPIAMQCIRPAGHDGTHRFVPIQDLVDGESLRSFHLGGDRWAWSRWDHPW